MKKIILFCLIMISVCLVQYSQESRALNFDYTSVSGKVLDTEGNPIPNIKLEMELAPDRELEMGLNVSGELQDEALSELKRRVGTGIFAAVTSNEKGEYKIGGIPIPGIYYLFVRNAENYLPTQLRFAFNASEKKVFKAPDFILRNRKTSGKIIPEKAIKEVEKSRKALAEKNTKKALKHMKKALEIDPEYAEGHYNLAVMYMSVKDDKQAITHLEKAVEIDKEYKPALETLGDIYYFKKDYEGAIKYFTQYLNIREVEGDLTEKDEKIFFKTGNCYKALKQNVKAVPFFEKYLDTKQKLGTLDKKDALIANDIAYYYYAKKNIDKSISFFAKAIQLDPNIGADTYMYIGNCYLVKRDGNNAVKYYEKYVKLYPKGKHIHQVKPLLEKLKKIPREK